MTSYTSWYPVAWSFRYAHDPTYSYNKIRVFNWIHQEHLRFSILSNLNVRILSAFGVTRWMSHTWTSTQKYTTMNSKVRVRTKISGSEQHCQNEGRNPRTHYRNLRMKGRILTPSPSTGSGTYGRGLKCCSIKYLHWAHSRNLNWIFKKD